MGSHARPMARRTFLSAAAALVAAACVPNRRHEAAAAPGPIDLVPDDDTGAPTPTTPTTALHRPTYPHDRAYVITHGPPASSAVALTIDDGTDEAVVAAYVDLATRTGLHISFSPNGKNPGWGRHADQLRPLVAAGQVQIVNHTWSHRNLLHLSESAIRDDLERNEDWIGETFGTSSRPWFRPPYGARDRRVDGIALDAGYQLVVMWNGSFGDAAVLTQAQLLHEADRWLQAGTVMLGHANHPTVTHLFDRIQDMIASKGLHAVTLDEMFADVDLPLPELRPSGSPRAPRRSSTTPARSSTTTPKRSTTTTAAPARTTTTPKPTTTVKPATTTTTAKHPNGGSGPPSS